MNIIENNIHDPTIQLSQVLTIIKGCVIILILSFTLLLIEIAHL